MRLFIVRFFILLGLVFPALASADMCRYVALVNGAATAGAPALHELTRGNAI
jgi:hypothetical protein